METVSSRWQAGGGDAFWGHSVAVPSKETESQWGKTDLKPGLADGPHWADSSDKQLEVQTWHEWQQHMQNESENTHMTGSIPAAIRGSKKKVQKQEKAAQDIRHECLHMKLALIYSLSRLLTAQ